MRRWTSVYLRLRSGDRRSAGRGENGYQSIFDDRSGHPRGRALPHSVEDRLMLILRRSTPSIFSTLGCPSGTHALLLDRPPLRALPHSVEDRLMPILRRSTPSIFSTPGCPSGTRALLLDRPPLRALPHSVEDRLMPTHRRSTPSIFSTPGCPSGHPCASP